MIKIDDYAFTYQGLCRKKNTRAGGYLLGFLVFLKPELLFDHLITPLNKGS